MIISHPDESAHVLDRPLPPASPSIFDHLAGWEGGEVAHLKPAVPNDALVHRQLRAGEFWRHIPAYADIDTDTFLDHAWQSRSSVTNPKRLRDTLGDLVAAA